MPSMAASPASSSTAASKTDSNSEPRMAALCSVRRARAGRRSTRDNSKPSMEDGTSTVPVVGTQRHPSASRVKTPSDISPRTTSSRYKGLPPAWRTMRLCSSRSIGYAAAPPNSAASWASIASSANGASRTTACGARPKSSVAGSNGGLPLSTTNRGRSHSQSDKVSMPSIDAASAHCRSSTTSTSGPCASRRSSTVRSVMKIWRLSRSGSISLECAIACKPKM